MTKFWLLIASLVVVGAVLAQPPVYTVTVYSYETWPIRLVACHNFAVFSDGRSSVCISWFPVSGPRGFADIGEQAGKNLSLDETLKLAKDKRAAVRAHGPYVIDKALYDAAVTRERDLRTGRLKYVGINRPTCPDAMNCIAAVMDVLEPYHGWPGIGDVAARSTVRHFRAHILSK